MALHFDIPITVFEYTDISKVLTAGAILGPGDFIQIANCFCCYPLDIHMSKTPTDISIGNILKITKNEIQKVIENQLLIYITFKNPAIVK